MSFLLDEGTHSYEQISEWFLEKGIADWSAHWPDQRNVPPGKFLMTATWWT